MVERFVDEKKLRRLWTSDKTLEEIGVELGGKEPFSAGTISQMGRRLELPRRRQKRHWRTIGDPDKMAVAEVKRQDKLAANRAAGLRPKMSTRVRRKRPEQNQA